MDVNNLCPNCMKELEKNHEGICPFCKKSPDAMGDITHQLKPFTILQGKYLVGGVLGEGGFGITYVGLDINLEIRVAIKEFYPNGYATRESNVTTELTAYAGQSMEVVHKWRDNFLKEARTLAKCTNLSGVVGVKDFFQENNTAYIVQEYLEGETLKDYAKAQGGKIPVDKLLKDMEPVITALGEVHKQGLIHRDISPDNIMILSDGKMKLLDFGAARDFTDNEEKSLSVLLKPGYAPEEQYRTKGNQGPWSDIYALAGTIYKCITGVTPPEAMERMRYDEIQWPSHMGVEISQETEQVLKKAMAVFAEDRFQSVDEFYAALYQGKDVKISEAPVFHTQTQSVVKEEITIKERNKTGIVATFVNKYLQLVINFVKVNKMIAIGIAVVALIGIIIIVGASKKEPDKEDESREFVTEETRHVLDEDTDEASAKNESLIEETEEETKESDITQEDIAEPEMEEIEDEEWTEPEMEEIEDEEWTAPEIQEGLVADGTVPTPLEYYDPSQHEYQIILGDVTWFEAQQFCEMNGGHLATITCIEEMEIIEEYLRGQAIHLSDPPYHIWLGGYANSGGFSWVTGEGPGVSNWEVGEPSGVDPNTGIAENHLVMKYSTDRGNWVWYDVPENISAYYPGKIAYLCEWED